MRFVFDRNAGSQFALSAPVARKKMKRAALVFSAIFLIVLGVLLFTNWNSLDDGIAYLQHMATYAPNANAPLEARGKFGFCYEFVKLRNAQRAQFIANYLDARGIAYQRLPIDDTFDNFFVPFAAQGPYTIFSAHYDKLFDDPDYQGASDNSAAVCMLLVAAKELKKMSPARPVAILFTGQEEVGLVGADAFYKYASQNNVRVADVLNFDNLGRAGIAARASGMRGGFVFALPLLGDFIYDGRALNAAPPLMQPDAALMQRVQRAAPVTLFDRMVATSDGTVFQARGWNAVNLSSDDMYYLEQTWHTYGDRAELWDQENFERALELVLRYAREDAK